MPVCVPIKEMKNTASFTETVMEAQEPVFVTKNGREAIVSMSPEVYEGLLRDAARARLYDIVERGLDDVRAPVVFPMQNALLQTCGPHMVLNG